MAQLPITTWNYKAEDETVRHMGSTAQDFYAAFGLGQDDRHISTVDAAGVSLAAIQALYARNQALEAENAELRARVDGLEAKNAAQQAQLDELQGCIEALEALARRGTFPFGLLGGSAGMFGMLLLVGLMWTRRRQL